jgi:hypothetical protein
MNKLKIYALWTIIALVSLLAVTSLVIAFTGTATRVFENVGVYNETSAIPETPVVQPEENLGGASPISTFNYQCINNACTYYLKGEFIDATTTPVSIPNPFLMSTTSKSDVVIKWTRDGAEGLTGATSTVDLVRLENTGVATTTFRIYCAAAPSPTATSSISYNILNSDLIATSTNFGIIENNLAATYSLGVGGGTVAKIMLTSALPYLMCKQVNPYGTTNDTAFTDPTNTFEGKYTVRISR